MLKGTRDARLAAAEADHAANLRCRDANTHIVREKDNEKSGLSCAQMKSC